MEQETTVSGTLEAAKAWLGQVTLGEPRHHKNLTIFPLLREETAGPAEETPPSPGHDTGKRKHRYQLLSDAIAAKQAVVEEVDEGGQVPFLAVTNGASRPILIPEGEILIGAKQNRTVNLTVLVAAQKTFKLPVSCVEQGRRSCSRVAHRDRGHLPGIRWSGRDSRGGSFNRGLPRREHQTQHFLRGLAGVPRIPGSRRFTAAQQLAALRGRQVCPGQGSIKKNRLCWNFIAKPTALSREYRLRIDYRPDVWGSPRVWVIEPDLTALADGRLLPHVYRQEPTRLCLYLPGTGEWAPWMCIADTTVPWSILWLYYFEDWLASGEWKGGGLHPERKNERDTTSFIDRRRRN